MQKVKWKSDDGVYITNGSKFIRCGKYILKLVGIHDPDDMDEDIFSFKEKITHLNNEFEKKHDLTDEVNEQLQNYLEDDSNSDSELCDKGEVVIEPTQEEDKYDSDDDDFAPDSLFEKNIEITTTITPRRSNRLQNITLRSRGEFYVDQRKNISKNAYLCLEIGIKNVLENVILSDAPPLLSSLEKKNICIFTDPYIGIISKETMNPGNYISFFGLITKKKDIVGSYGCLKFLDYYLHQDAGGSDNLWIRPSCSPNIKITTKKIVRNRIALVGIVLSPVVHGTLLTAQFSAFTPSLIYSFCKCEAEDCSFILCPKYKLMLCSFINSLVHVDDMEEGWNDWKDEDTFIVINSQQKKNAKFSEKYSHLKKIDMFKSMSVRHRNYHKVGEDEDEDSVVNTEKPGKCKSCKKRLCSNYGINRDMLTKYINIGDMFYLINKRFLSSDKITHISCRGYKFLIKIYHLFRYLIYEHNLKFKKWFKAELDKRNESSTISVMNTSNNEINTEETNIVNNEVNTEETNIVNNEINTEECNIVKNDLQIEKNQTPIDKFSTEESNTDQQLLKNQCANLQIEEYIQPSKRSLELSNNDIPIKKRKKRKKNKK